MQPFNWGRFVTRININAPTDRIYACWCTQSGMEAWFLRLCEFSDMNGNKRAPHDPVATGDRYLWRWHGWCDDTTETGTILHCNGKDTHQFSFGKAGNCTVTIRQELGETIVELMQENIPDTEDGKRIWHLGCKTGWTFYLANLKSFLEGGIDLRNKNEQLTEMLNS